MHQPFYRNPYTHKFELPWARLHGLKDYYGMVAILKDFPQIKATFNLVPSLLIQLESYLKGETDIFQDVSRKDAHNLHTEEIHFLARHFFSANYENLVKPWPRYRYLYEKKQRFQRSPDDHPPWEKIFTTDEIRDLQVWFHLCHFDELYKENDERVKHLLKKGQHFTEGDKKEVGAIEMELLGKIIPEYRKYSESGQIEVSTTPFYHPILPLLVDPQLGREANPTLPPYDLHFNWKEDAIYQLESALAYMEKAMGRKPAGIWPSEGSLSGDILAIMDEMGIRWTATDEANLSRSLSIPINRDHHFIVRNPEVLYKPYSLENRQIKIFFRDRHISDLIGFHYRRMSPGDAARDFVERIKASIPHSESQAHNYVVPVILDGENAWEYYSNSGRSFLREVFRLITEDNKLEAVTFSDALEGGVASGKLTRFSAGSWINANFDIWIGSEDDRKGWKLLKQTRDTLETCYADLPGEKRQEAREYISIAEGSDWFWWFGTENYTPDLDIFDNLFRKNLQKVYDIIGKQVPYEFSFPVYSISSETQVVVTTPSRPLLPKIDGRISSYFEWLYSGVIDVSNIGGAMNISNPLVNKLFYGFGPDHFYIRIDTKISAAGILEKGYSLKINVKTSTIYKELKIFPQTPSPDAEIEPELSIGDIIEIAIHMSTLHIKEGDNLFFQLEWRLNDNFQLQIPPLDFFQVLVPKTKDYNRFWLV